MNHQDIYINAIILAGGKSKRFNGKNKAFLKINHQTIIEIILEKLRFVFKDVFIVVNDSRIYNLEAKIVEDIYPEKGPLGGIYAGLLVSDTNYNFIVGCDMPFLKPALLEFMREESLRYQSSFDILVPKIDDDFQPLHAIYSRNCINFIEEHIKNNQLKIKEFYKNVTGSLLLKEIPEEIIKKYDDKFLSFFNINTPELYSEALSKFIQ